MNSASLSIFEKERYSRVEVRRAISQDSSIRSKEEGPTLRFYRCDDSNHRKSEITNMIKRLIPQINGIFHYRTLAKYFFMNDNLPKTGIEVTQKPKSHFKSVFSQKSNSILSVSSTEKVDNRTKNLDFNFKNFFPSIGQNKNHDKD